MLAALTLAACSQAPQAPQARPSEPLDAVRIKLPEAGAEPSPRPSGAVPAWSGNGRAAALAYPGEKPVLSVECTGTRLVVTRYEVAETGAQALFALVGNGMVLRLPVDATALPGEKWPVWRGSLDAASEKAGVFLGAKLAGTLPGAGMLEVPTGPALHAVVTGCAGDAPVAAGTPEPRNSAEPGE